MGKPAEWVLDTNVVVSGLLSPMGPPGRLVDAVLGGRLRMVVDDRILFEYREVLARPKFGFEAGRRVAFFGLMAFQIHLTAAPIEGMLVSDPDDTTFLELAAASESRVLITGNLKHYLAKSRGPVEVLSPGAAVDRLINS